MLVSRTHSSPLAVSLLPPFSSLRLLSSLLPFLCLSLPLLFPSSCRCSAQQVKSNLIVGVRQSIYLTLSINLFRTCLLTTLPKGSIPTHTHTSTHFYTHPHTLPHFPYTPTQYALEHVVYVHKFDAPLYNVIPIFIYAYFWENKEFYTRLSCCAIYRHFSLCFCQLHLQLFLVNLLNIFPNVLQNLL